MSWFIGYTGKNNPVLNEYISSLNLIQKDEIINENLHLLHTEKTENLIINLKNGSSGWIICGIPVSAEAGKLKFMKKDDWVDILSGKEFNLKNINGHFTGIIWNDETITFFNDSLGLIDIYFLKVNSNYFFSTRLDRIAKFNKENKININEFSTNWILPHQISWASILNDVIMLDPGGIINISSGIFEKKNSPWRPDFNRNSKPEEFTYALDNFIKLPSSANEKINLGLSGGIDSRVLLQILFSNKIAPFATHTFGNPLADGKIAKEIVNDHKLEHRFFLFLFRIPISY